MGFCYFYRDYHHGNRLYFIELQSKVNVAFVAAYIFCSLCLGHNSLESAWLAPFHLSGLFEWNFFKGASLPLSLTCMHIHTYMYAFHCLVLFYTLHLSLPEITWYLLICLLLVLSIIFPIICFTHCVSLGLINLLLNNSIE